MTRIVLASGSAIRRRLLQDAGISMRVVAHAVDEREVAARSGNPRSVARSLAMAKAKSASDRHPEAFVIGADQTLELAGEMLTKPGNRAAAKRQLRRLAGKSHMLHSAFAVAHASAIAARGIRSARLTMRPLDDRAIDAYLDLAGDDILASVGAYQIESVGIRLFERIDGDYFTILGLPMMPLLAALRRLGAIDS